MSKTFKDAFNKEKGPTWGLLWSKYYEKIRWQLHNKGYDFTRSYAPGPSASGPHTRRQDIELSYGSGPGANSFGDDFSFSGENFGDFFNDVSDTFPSISQFGPSWESLKFWYLIMRSNVREVQWKTVVKCRTNKYIYLSIYLQLRLSDIVTLYLLPWGWQADMKSKCCCHVTWQDRIYPGDHTAIWHSQLCWPWAGVTVVCIITIMSPHPRIVGNR